MTRLQVLLLLLSACLSLTLAKNFDDDESADGGFFFLFNDDNSTEHSNSTDDRHREEFQRTKDDVRRLLNNRTEVFRTEFQFKKARGFLVDLTADQLKEMRHQMGSRGAFYPNRKITLNLPSKAQVVDVASIPKKVGATATCAGKTCCGRTVNINYNSNLDWLDRTRNGKYCSPGDDSTKMDVFVLDTGVDRTHPDFGGRVATIDDCSSRGPAPWTRYLDKVGHGTHVAGTIGSNTYGVTPNVLIHSVKVLNDQGSGTDANLICGFSTVDLWLQQNPTKQAIISLSLGYSANNPVINNAVTSLVSTYSSRLLVVVAAGNSNVLGCSVTLASVDAAIAVGSTDATLSESSFSNYGSCVDVMAPGENILSTYPSNRYAIMSGTSMATPLVSGVLAQYWLQNSTLTGLALRAAIGSGSSALHAPLVINQKSGSPNKLIQYNCPWSVCV